ncbi:bacteriophage antitermination protein Q [Atlantibacter hermannii]|uniref:bacteriophage antitermination protein Q n=1 Tax=Atlantibacter hermannii TaxID=565 RepID=UPI002DB9AED5|nr:bacteriophage antitermination protein Q [Atlantibacter hermannii]MEB7926146.1 bacteriophage antitermination protein Q [Atlantibacter hermannii]
MLQLDFVRDELAAALLPFSQSSRNQIVAMAERAAASDKFTSKPTREISMGETDVIVIEAEPVRCTEGKRYKTSTIPVSPVIFCQVSWCNALRQLPAPYSAWLNYCYGDLLSFEYQQVLTVHIWNGLKIYHAESNLPEMTAETERKFKALTWLAVQESKNFINRAEYRYKPKDLSRLLGITHANWRNNYQARWKFLLECGNQLDREALIHVTQLRTAANSSRR